MDPTPEPSISVDPFGPIDPDLFPPPPPWLLPTIWVIFWVAVAVVSTLIVMWWLSRRRDHQAMLAQRRTDWIDLNDLDPRADRRRPKSPRVVREDPEPRRKPRAAPPEGDGGAEDDDGTDGDGGAGSDDGAGSEDGKA